MPEGGLTSCIIFISSLLVLLMNLNLVSGKRRMNKTHNNIIGFIAVGIIVAGLELSFSVMVYSDVRTECSLSSLNVTLSMAEGFAGAVYARGFPLQCRAMGSGETSVSLHLTASGCGVRITPHEDGGLLYSVVVEVQMAKHLQQVTDPVLPVSCVLSEEKMVLHFPALQVNKSKTRVLFELNKLNSSRRYYSTLVWLMLDRRKCESVFGVHLRLIIRVKSP